jgi:peptide methionine sulfoxide reductase msrA/msrB
VATWPAFVILPVTGLELRGQDMKGADVGSGKLNPEEERVIVHKGTESPFSGKYYLHHEDETHHCRSCNAPLFRSEHKFESGCGWPGFDDSMPDAVKQQPDADGRRTEIVCAACGAHLGHVFFGEGFINKNVRHCVNSVSLMFDPSEQTAGSVRAYFAGGCFWGIEYCMKQAEGVITTRVGYMGGDKSDPTYEQVCAGTTGHAETVEVVFDPSKTSFEILAKYFFEIHDPTQISHQGPDIEHQYRSAVFWVDDEQRKTTERLINTLKGEGYPVVTESVSAGTFWLAEDYHQNYYDKSGKQPYCHAYEKRF